MKLLIEVTLEKQEGPTLDADTIFESVEDCLDGEAFWGQDPDKEAESGYTVTSVKLVTS